MPHWVRFRHGDSIGFGTLADDTITVHHGDMFDSPQANGARLPRSNVTLLAPTTPSKVIALWNNFHALAAKLGVAEPREPLYLLKAPSSVTGPDAAVGRPPSYDGKIVYEGELAIVIGRSCSNVSVADADAHIFGYTCVNDITAADIISRDATFAQWARAKGFDGFCPFGPAIATDVDPAALVVRTVLDGAERQNYPIADMIFSAAELVSRISGDMTLHPGDIICCGTSLGVGAMKAEVSTVTVAIDGIGELTNTLRQ
ncbi:fumarylacetoacetate hydrolase family protein [Bradyrhizobium sp. U87765 SZCCT0131]|uniref:fumarylacetoacetate hydrolase family protein n=1 Tax=unclassified Bradyrhizobium TaxID=2631580 RepID=UPI001BACBB88|nr:MULTISPECIES: fumarylacetoacetate hydrolase family protein [unclassified Bradyrhizobium]MBR1219466.1 fumarylacetoacetate hydrolase family protein [Bradyrhizobium sp. U87765 SZCCT0131]MBR1262117.1 fumarylacetoacetate hydrolase family protein [Bradyrhizobium sp. U87765 SZCCT0134]MBR1308700.1 fumarylacetoacetate hydrolase family protein [Bradyrhizobium sp. U87765 SZCCT0110]MBR1317899.1 fumarylacetoacetate hydrolase family protein [Bradyrhizobium sp. U87765 SZCCT0109]MBR1351602.1 fumarylacetoac